MTTKPSTKDLRSQIPLILYEEPSSRDSKEIPFPYIEVAKEGMMPPVLFIFEYKHTGETEPDDKGREVAVVDQIPHKYVDMELLKEKLPADVNDQVRIALGMKPLKEAQDSGQKILDKVYSNFNENVKSELENMKQTQEKKLTEYFAEKTGKQGN